LAWQFLPGVKLFAPFFGAVVGVREPHAA